MCGRFTIISEKEVIEKRFRAKFSIPYKPRYNAAPSQPLPIIIQDDPLHIVFGHWGYPIHLGKIDKEIINIRGESFETKAMFRHSLEERRCIVIADGFYEWKRGASASTPYRITLHADGPFAMAGVYHIPKDGNEKNPQFAIITTTPNALMQKIHDRMPVILPMAQEAAWLDRKTSLIDILDDLKPYPYKEMIARSVPRIVNNPKNDSPAMIGLK